MLSLFYVYFIEIDEHREIIYVKLTLGLQILNGDNTLMFSTFSAGQTQNSLPYFSLPFENFILFMSKESGRQ